MSCSRIQHSASMPEPVSPQSQVEHSITEPSVSNSFDLDHAGCFVGPYLGLNCLQRLSAGDNSGHKQTKR